MSKWGYMLLLDIGKCCPESIRCNNNIYYFTKSLVNRIDMKPYGDPQIVMFGEGNKKGYTLTQLIETSNISAHFVEEGNGAFIDIFSCKKYDIETVVKTVNEYFKPETVVRRYFERDIPEKVYMK